MKKNLSILYVEDDELVREGLRLLIEKIANVGCVRVAQNGREALAMVEELQPDVVITDIEMPFVDGIEMTRQLHIRYPKIAVVMLTGQRDGTHLSGALNAGAAGYLLKSSAVPELHIAIQATSNGEAYITPRMQRTLISERTSVPNVSANRSPIRLTSRQHETLKLIATGRTNKEIATFLNLRLKTVDNHRTRLMKRLGVHNAAQLLDRARENKLL